MAFAHGGGSFPATIGRIEHGFNVRPDLVAVDNDVNPREYLGRFWLDSLVHDPAMLRYIVDLVGRDKVALGTDYPSPSVSWNRGSSSIPWRNTTRTPRPVCWVRMRWTGWGSRFTVAPSPDRSACVAHPARSR